MKILLQWLLSTLALIVSAKIVPGVTVGDFWQTFWLAAVLGLLNVVFKPILIILTLPVNILTLGLFTFVINTTIILFASSLVKGFEVGGFWNAMLFGIVLSIISSLLNAVTK